MRETAGLARDFGGDVRVVNDRDRRAGEDFGQLVRRRRRVAGPSVPRRGPAVRRRARRAVRASAGRDLSLAYSPGVAYACLAIEADPSLAAEYTSRGNLVGVVTNGTAVLGLGDIGPLAGKPVMEGKGCLFKKFAGIDVFDIELTEKRPGQAGRDHRRARAHAGRHQPRGHQGAGVLLHRDAS